MQLFSTYESDQNESKLKRRDTETFEKSALHSLFSIFDLTLRLFVRRFALLFFRDSRVNKFLHLLKQMLISTANG